MMRVSSLDDLLARKSTSGLVTQFSSFNYSEGQRLLLVEGSQCDLRHNCQKQREVFPARTYWSGTEGNITVVT